MRDALTGFGFRDKAENVLVLSISLTLPPNQPTPKTQPCTYPHTLIAPPHPLHTHTPADVTGLTQCIACPAGGTTNSVSRVHANTSLAETL